MDLRIYGYRLGHGEGGGGFGGVALAVGRGTHLEGEGAATGDVGIGDVVAVEGLTVEGGALNVDVLRAVVESLDDELMAIIHRDGGLAEEGRAENVLVGAGRDGVEAEG